jgi:hypothetical protein
MARRLVACVPDRPSSLNGIVLSGNWKRDALLQKRFKTDAAIIEDELDVLVARDRAILATFLCTDA